MIKLINAYDLIDIIEKEKDDTQGCESNHDLVIRNGTYIHLVKCITEIPEFYNIKERMISVIEELQNEKEYELSGMYNSSFEHRAAEERMYYKNEIIDEVIEIVKKGFGLNG